APCAPIPGGRFPGGTSGPSVGHAAPEAAHGGGIGLVQHGDPVPIDVRERALTLDIDEDELERRRAEQERREKPWTPVNRDRPITKALRAYANMATSADMGAVRIVDGHIA